MVACAGGGTAAASDVFSESARALRVLTAALVTLVHSPPHRGPEPVLHLHILIPRIFHPSMLPWGVGAYAELVSTVQSEAPTIPASHSIDLKGAPQVDVLAKAAEKKSSGTPTQPRNLERGRYISTGAEAVGAAAKSVEAERSAASTASRSPIPAAVMREAGSDPQAPFASLLCSSPSFLLIPSSVGMTLTPEQFRRLATSDGGAGSLNRRERGVVDIKWAGSSRYPKCMVRKMSSCHHLREPVVEAHVATACIQWESAPAAEPATYCWAPRSEIARAHDLVTPFPWASPR